MLDSKKWFNYLLIALSLKITLSAFAAGSEHSPLMRHILYFAENGLLSYESMIEAHKELGFHDSKLLKSKIQAIIKFAKAEGKKDELIDAVSKFAKELEGLENPASAGIWKTDGQIDYTVLNSITDKATTINDTKVITREVIDSHVKNRQAETSGSSGIATWVWYGWLYVPITWKRVTSGSFDEMFKYLGDVDGHEDAISVDKFIRFYEESDEVLKDLEESVSKC